MWKYLATLLVSLPTASLAQQIAISNYVSPFDISQVSLNGITAGPDGALWFLDSLKIGRITPAGAITEYQTGGGTGIALGPDGALWFSAAVSIGRLTTAGAVTQFPIPTENGNPESITAGPDGALWFTEISGNNIGRITTAGAITEFPVPTPDSFPMGIVAGSDGALWFTENGSRKIGRVTTAGVFTEYPVAITGLTCSPGGITAGSDGALWFTDGCSHIWRITTAGAATDYLVRNNSQPFAIMAGPDGALWFTESAGAALGRITTAGVFTEYHVPGPGNTLDSSITTGPDGEVWFTEPFTGLGGHTSMIGEAFFETASLVASPPKGHYGANLTFTGSGFGPDEAVQIYAKGVGSTVLANATADATGSFTATARAPQSTFGPRLFVGVGQTSRKLGAASFAMGPSLILTPNSGPAGTTVTVEGFGWATAEQITVFWKNPNTALGNAKADQLGTFNGKASLQFTVPAGALPGTNVVYASGSQTAAVLGLGTFTVQ